MKTIIITTSFFGNPVSDFYKSISEHFIKNNYKVIFIFDGLLDSLPENTERLKYFTWKSKRPTNLKDFVFFYKLVKKEKPILCISNFGSHNVVTIVSYLLNVKNRINYIHTTSKQLELDKTGSLLKSKTNKLRKKIVNKLNTHFFTNSNGNKNDFVKNQNINSDKISVIPLLINDTNKELKKYEEREFCLCIVGRLNHSKGHKNLMYCMKGVIKKFPKLKLKIAGSGSLHNELQTYAKELQIENNIIFLGNVARNEISNLFSSSLISISSSIDEAFGLVNIEALREGTPLLCTKTAGSLDIIENKVNGLFFDSKDVNSFVTSIETILSEYESYSNNARKSFVERYCLKNSIKSYEIIKYFA